jgi:hypothetical protein
MYFVDKKVWWFVVHQTIMTTDWLTYVNEINREWIYER